MPAPEVAGGVGGPGRSTLLDLAISISPSGRLSADRAAAVQLHSLGSPSLAELTRESIKPLAKRRCRWRN
jgi:hypothetical protein